MKFTTTALALVGAASAAPAPSPVLFELVVSAPGSSVDGKKVSTCHAGALIEAACIADDGSSFTFDTPENAQPIIKEVSAPGTVVFKYQAGDNEPTDLTLNLFGDYASDVQEALFEPTTTGAPIVFDNTDKAGIISYLDDTVSPVEGGQPRLYTNWYVCETYYQSYTYQTLSWVVGAGSQKPQNPSCVKVDLTRKYL